MADALLRGSSVRAKVQVVGYSTLGGKTGKLDEAVNRELNENASRDLKFNLL